jgi:hypothetical protein
MLENFHRLRGKGDTLSAVEAAFQMRPRITSAMADKHTPTDKLKAALKAAGTSASAQREWLGAVRDG